jgi:glucose-6-phosphate-specific signal transduction histidine kinase
MDVGETGKRSWWRVGWDPKVNVGSVVTIVTVILLAGASYRDINSNIAELKDEVVKIHSKEAEAEVRRSIWYEWKGNIDSGVTAIQRQLDLLTRMISKQSRRDVPKETKEGLLIK